MSELRTFPRLVIAGLSGSAGKTLVSLGLLSLLRRAGINIRAFKKGPDYIDASWLTWASSGVARNLDTYLMGPGRVLESFSRHALSDGINVIEGNRGLYDGFDAAGSHSTAALARLLSAPVILIVNANKVTRTAAAFVLGCQKLDPEIAIRGVILNNVSGERQRDIVQSAIESACSIPVLGALPRAKTVLLPERHLGLVPPEEHWAAEQLEQDVLKLIDGTLDIEELLTIARSAPPLRTAPAATKLMPVSARVKIGYLKDSAFSFYYPENLEHLEKAGGTLNPISALNATELPEDLHALYIGGGFPETHAHALSENTSFLNSLREASLRGLPIYAECGGLILLAKDFSWKGSRYPMAGVFPIEVEFCESPQGHGYTELRVDSPNPFLPTGLTLRGHEFHYSRIARCGETLSTACAVNRGAGCFDKRDFIVINNVAATYTHLHALASPEWAEGILNAARVFASQPGLHEVASEIEVTGRQ